MQYRYIPKGVCSRAIDIELDGETIKNVRFHGGCDGNLKGISLLVKETHADLSKHHVRISLQRLSARDLTEK